MKDRISVHNDKKYSKDSFVNRIKYNFFMDVAFIRIEFVPGIMFVDNRTELIPRILSIIG